MTGFGDAYGKFNEINGVYGHLTGFADDPIGSTLGLEADAIGAAQSYGAPILKGLGFAKQAKFLEAAETPIIEAGLLALATMGNMCGFGAPDEGQGFGQGSDAYEKIGNRLSATDAPGSWTGNGSENYTGQNDAQQERADTMSQTDRGIQHVLEAEAKQVEATRQVIDYSSTALTMAIIPAVAALAIEIPPGAGVALSMEIQTAAVIATLPPATAAMTTLNALALTNASKISTLSEGYTRASDEVFSGGASGAGRELSVETGDLRKLASHQTSVATAAVQANQTTNDTGMNVFASHGLVCSATTGAVAAAVAGRTAASRVIHSESTELAHDLHQAARQYDSTDHRLRDAVDGEMHPR